MQSLLEVNHVSFSYHSESGETTALSDITFSLKEGEFVSIVGPSGCGKSTLLSLISGIRPDSPSRPGCPGFSYRDWIYASKRPFI